MKIFVSGSQGFICGYLVEELLNAGYKVTGLDNLSKYGRTRRSYEGHKNYTFVKGDAKNIGLMKELISDCDQAVAAAAMIGGISLFHEYAYDLIAENERIIASTFDAAIWAFKHRKLKKINVLSSSMVFESAKKFPTPEGEQLKSPPPLSTYGFQKLACEYFAKGAWEQYELPYTIIRPFNCIGIGEKRALCDKEIPFGQHKTCDEPCCAGPCAKGPEGAISASHTRQRRPDKALYVRRGPGKGHKAVHREQKGGQ